jgi:hypothetical protein
MVLLYESFAIVSGKKKIRAKIVGSTKWIGVFSLSPVTRSEPTINNKHLLALFESWVRWGLMLCALR